MGELLALLKAILAFIPANFWAGLAGGIIRALLRPAKSIWHSIGIVFVGTTMATLIVPIFVYWAHLDGSNTALIAAISSVVGMTGKDVAEGIIEMSQRWSKDPRLPTSGTMAGLAEAVNSSNSSQNVKPIDPVEASDENPPKATNHQSKHNGSVNT